MQRSRHHRPWIEDQAMASIVQWHWHVNLGQFQQWAVTFNCPMRFPSMSVRQVESKTPKHEVADSFKQLLKINFLHCSSFHDHFRLIALDHISLQLQTNHAQHFLGPLFSIAGLFSIQDCWKQGLESCLNLHVEPLADSFTSDPMSSPDKNYSVFDVLKSSKNGKQPSSTPDDAWGSVTGFIMKGDMVD